MSTECIQTELDLGRSGARKLVGAFDGGVSVFTVFETSRRSG